MSISRLPRLYFNGHFSWNPSTNNNDDYSVPANYAPPLNPPVIPFDPASAMPNWPWLREQSFDGAPVTQANFRQWSWQEPYDLGKDAEGHDRRLPPSEWNFFGGMECGFVTDSFPSLEQPPNPHQPGTPVFSKPSGTKISSFATPEGRLVADQDPVGLELHFNAAPPKGPFGASPKLIDVNPQSPFTSQIFADDFQLGDGSNGFAAPLTQPMQSRWLYFNRNYNLDQGLMIAGVASAVFQTTMANGDIDWSDGSEAISELREAAEQGAGVMFRMVSYDTMYFNGEFFGPLGTNQFPGMMKMRDLYVQYFNDLERYKAGLLADPPPPPCNRAYSRTVGWLGVWEPDEYVTFPGGRLLTPYVLPYQPYQPTGDNVPGPISPDADVEKAAPLGPLVVERDPDFTRITVDLISTLPELTSQGDFAPTGPIDLGISIEGTYYKLLTIIDDPVAYTKHYAISSGLLDIPIGAFEPVLGEPLTMEQFDQNPLVLTAGSYPSVGGEPTQTVALFEAALNAQTNTRGLYVDEPDDAIGGPTTTFVIEVKDRNTRPNDQIGLVVLQADANFNLLTGNDRKLEVSYQAPSGQWIDIDNETLIDASSGTVTVGLRGCSGAHATVAGALPTIAFLPVGHADLPPGLSPETPVAAFAAGIGVELAKQGWPSNPNLLLSTGYCAVRLWPYHRVQRTAFENYLATMPSVDEVNNWVFANVYETFHLMYPVMDFIGTPQRFQAWRGRILEVTKPENFWTSGYMPPTRTLSSAQRRIIERYDEYLSGVNLVGGLRSGTAGDPIPSRG